MVNLKNVIYIIILLVLVGCTDQKEQTNNNQEQITENMQNDDNDNEQDEENEEVEGSNNDELPPNQEDLGMGDTAEIKSNLYHAEVTLNSAEAVSEMNGQMAQLDKFIKTKITIKNIGAQAFDAYNLVMALELTDSLDGGGFSDIADSLGAEALQGTIEPGKELTGTLVMHARNSDTYFLIAGRGLSDDGAGVMNRAVWTFKL